MSRGKTKKINIPITEASEVSESSRSPSPVNQSDFFHHFSSNAPSSSKHSYKSESSVHTSASYYSESSRRDTNNVTERSTQESDAELIKQITKSMRSIKNEKYRVEPTVITKMENVKLDDIIKPRENRINEIKAYLKDKNIISFIDLDGTSSELFADQHRCNDQNCSNINCIIPRQYLNLKEMVKAMDLNLFYISSGSTGHTFQALRIKRDERGKRVKNADGHTIFSGQLAFAFKVIAYPKCGYGWYDDISRPENVELRIIKQLAGMVIRGETPHVVIPIFVFKTSIIPFLDTQSACINIDNRENKLYKEFLELYNKGKLEEHVSVLVTEWAEAGDLMTYIYNNYRTTMTEKVWKVIIFQIVHTFARIQLRYPDFRHNDAKTNNMLLQKIAPNNGNNTTAKNSFMYTFRESKDATVRYYFEIPNIGLHAKITDFDFSCNGDEIVNSKVESVWAHEEVKLSSKRNHYYDLHYFINTLSDKKLYPEFNKYVPNSIKDFISRVVPAKYHININPRSQFLTENGRLIVDDEYTTPKKLILGDPLFEEYRFVGNVD